MRLFAIDSDNAVTAFPAAEQIPEGQQQFASEKELAKLAAEWPPQRLVQIWNGFAGVAGPFGDLKPVKKFTDRKTAVKRSCPHLRSSRSYFVPVPRQMRQLLFCTCGWAKLAGGLPATLFLWF